MHDAGTEARTETLQQLAARLGQGQSRPAIRYFNRSEETTWTYERLAGAVDRLAAGLAGEGVGRETPVAVIGGNCPEWVLACLAILRCGATFVPMDAQLGADGFAHIVEDSGARLVFASAAAASRHGDAAERLGVTLVGLEPGEAVGRTWADLATAAAVDLPSAAPQDCAALFYTSGTTGPPKGVPLSHRNIAHQIASLAAAELVGAGERVLVPLPLHHVYPFVVGTLTPLSLQLTLIFAGGFTGTQVLNALQRGEATIMIGVPRLYDALVSGLHARLHSLGGVARPLMAVLLAASGATYRRLGWRIGRRLLAPLHRQFAPHLRTLVSGGAALKPALATELEVFGWRVATGYGLTETSPMVTFDRPGEAQFDTVGMPIPGTEIRAGDSAEQPSEVLVRGPGVFAGYRNLPDKTREALTDDGWYRTGDLGWTDAQGRLHLAGRSSTVIVTEAGKNLQPEEIEDAYQTHPLIAEIAVLQRDGKLCGLIVPDLRAIGDEPVEAAMRKAVSAVGHDLPSYKRLADYALTREPIARTRLGKPRRHLIAAHYEAARGEKVAVEKKDLRPIAIADMKDDDRALLDDSAVAAAWDLLTERFDDKRLTPDSDLQLDLGIDSIDWLDLSFAVADRSGVTLAEEVIADISTVRDLLEAIADGEVGVPQVSPLADPDAALSDAQKSWMQPQGAFAAVAGSVFYAINWVLCRSLFLRRVEGREHLATATPLVLAPNHASYLDPFVLAAALDRGWLRRTYWAGWTGVVFTSPIRRSFAKVSRVLPVDPDRAAASSLAFGAAALDQGNNLIWFPEGARSRDGRLQEFRSGLGMLIEHHKPQVVPVVIAGTYDAWPAGRRFPRPKRVTIRFLRPRDADALIAAGTGESEAARIVDGIKRAIAEELGESL